MFKKWLLSMWITLCLCCIVVSVIYGLAAQTTAAPKSGSSLSAPPSESAIPATAAPAMQRVTPVEDVPALEPEPIDIVFAGDTLMDWSVRTAIEQNGPDFPFQYIKGDVQKTDYAVLNLETAITTRTDKVDYQIYTFKSDPIGLQGIKNAGFDLVTLANNHVLDYKEGGLLDTLHYVQEAGLAYVGAGKNAAEAYSSKTVEIKGQKVRFLAFSHFLPDTSWYAGEYHAGVASGYQQERVLSIIEKEKSGADALIVYFHWGEEKNNRPLEWQRTYAKKMIDSGADALVGSHPHVLQGFEYYKGRPIAYSLGNFLFPDYVKGPAAQTGLLNLHLENGKVTVEFKPYAIGKNQIVTLPAAERANTLQYLESISYGTKRVGSAFVDGAKAVDAQR